MTGDLVPMVIALTLLEVILCWLALRLIWPDVKRQFLHFLDAVRNDQNDKKR